MQKDKLIPGLILVAIGAAFLLNNFGYVHFHWANIFHLWPIFLVIAGVNLVFAHNNSTWATILKFGVAIIGLGLLFFGDFHGRFNYWPGYHYNFSDNDNNDKDDDDDDNDTTNTKFIGHGNFNEPYKADIKVARLDISGGATSYSLKDTTNQLFSGSTDDTHNWYDFSHHMDDSVYVVDFHMRNHHGFNFDSDKNAAIMRLNPNPEWQIYVNTGASSVDFDLSLFKVREFKLNGGAASFKVKFGMPLAMTDIDISAGVSGVDVSIPKDAACIIETNSALSGNDFPGFNDIGDNRHETPGYETAKNKMHIHISGGLSGFKVTRY